MERRRQTRGNCLCSAALSGAASKRGPLGISVGMPHITLIPQQQNRPAEPFGSRSGQGRPETREVSTVLDEARGTSRPSSCLGGSEVC